MATAAGRPPHFEDKDFSHSRLEVIPETLRTVNPREAIARLMAGPVAGDENSPTGGTDSMRTTE